MIASAVMPMVKVQVCGERSGLLHQLPQHALVKADPAMTLPVGPLSVLWEDPDR